MVRKTQFCLLLLLNFVLFTACAQHGECEKVIKPTEEAEASHGIKHTTMHPYGGWSCPDNLRGFPAVDLAHFDQVPVVNGRLPTKEETRNGTSLMFFDTTAIPSAKPLDMQMPRLARYYSKYTQKNELVIVIQAVEADHDTVVGFRFLNGGNGSGWFEEIHFLTAEEADAIGSTPFVALEKDIDAPPTKVWEVMTSPTHAKTLGAMLGSNTYFESDWKQDAEVKFKRGETDVLSTGKITAYWPDTYIQVDYNNDGQHYVEKYLIMDNEDHTGSHLKVVSGPYGADYPLRNQAWGHWLEQLQVLSEGF